MPFSVKIHCVCDISVYVQNLVVSTTTKRRKFVFVNLAIMESYVYYKT